MNQIKTIALLAALTIFVIVVAGAIGGEQALLPALIISIGINIFSYFYSDKIALKANGAKKISREESPKLYSYVDQMAKKANIPTPAMYLIPESQANAFATGRNPQHAAIAVTQGLLDNLSKEEVGAVIAHEMGHIKNRDILIASIASVLASVVSYIAQMAMFFGSRNDDNNGSAIGGLLTLIFAPLTATIIQLAISRQREYQADASAAKIIGSGKPLANALENIHRSISSYPMKKANPAFSSMYISNPMSNVNKFLGNLFSTHPPVEDRILRLIDM